MRKANIRGTKKCAFCQFWDDPKGSAISPVAPAINLWEYDEKMVRTCMKSCVDVAGGGNCDQYQCKIRSL